jgi:hypothetical protein
MKSKLISVLAAIFALTALPFAGQAQTYVAQAGVSLVTGQAATATFTTGAVRLPAYSGTGTLNITESGITGSPSGCTIALAYQQNNTTTATAAVASIAFTPSTGTQQLPVSPAVLSGDNYVATYACSSAYPTAGLMSISFSPTDTASLDPCLTGAKSSAAVSSVTTLAQIVALSTGKKIYVCGLTVSVGTAGTVELEYGTGSNCASGTTALTGTYNLAVGIPSMFGINGTITTVPVSNALCLVATQSANGVVTYVQQ